MRLKTVESQVGELWMLLKVFSEFTKFLESIDLFRAHRQTMRSFQNAAAMANIEVPTTHDDRILNEKIAENDFCRFSETMNLTDLGSALENSIKRVAGGGGAKMTELEHWIQMELGSTLAELVNEELTSNGGAMSNEAIVTRVINSSVYAEANSELHHRLVARLTQIKERYARPGTIDSGDCSLSLQTSSSLVNNT